MLEGLKGLKIGKFVKRWSLSARAEMGGRGWDSAYTGEDSMGVTRG